MAANTCNPSAREAETGRCLGLLGQQDQVSELQIQGESLSQMGTIEDDT